MRFHRRSAVLAAAICLMGGVAAHADGAGPVPVGQVCGPPYVTGDPDLGPTFLPKAHYLGAILRGYVPFGGLKPQHFLSRYWDYTAQNYRFPPDSGFGRSGNYPNGRLLAKTTFLQAGMKLDRFGGNGGSFMSPMGDAFSKRALPPRNLNTNPADPQHVCNYHAFRVLKSFRVEVGPIAPAFQQPGGGTQYHVVSRLIPEAPPLPEEVPISWLLDNHFLEELVPVYRTTGTRRLTGTVRQGVPQR